MKNWMTLFSVLVLCLSVVSIEGCRRGSASSSTLNQCLRSCDNYERCEVLHPEGNCEIACEDEDDRTGDCDDAARAYFRCLSEANCIELEMGFGACPDEFGEFGDACGF